MELVEKMTRRPTDQPWEQTTNPLGSFGSGVVIPVSPAPPPPPPLTGLNRFTLDDDKDEA